MVSFLGIRTYVIIQTCLLKQSIQYDMQLIFIVSSFVV